MKVMTTWDESINLIQCPMAERPVAEIPDELWEELQRVDRRRAEIIGLVEALEAEVNANQKPHREFLDSMSIDRKSRLRIGRK